MQNERVMKRSLGTWSLMAAIYFCVSGGPFGLEPVIQLGPGLAILLILVTPLIWSLPAALMTAELGSAIPEEGGYYAWVKRAMGQPWGFFSGWWSWIYSWVDVAIYPTLFVAYLGRFLELAGYHPSFEQNPWLKWGAGLLVIVPLTLLNIRGTKLMGQSGLTFFFILLAPFVILVLFGMSHVLANPSQAVHPFSADPKGTSGAFSVGLFAVMWNYLGWDSMSTVTGEVKNPQRTVSRALAIGFPVVIVTYLLPVLVGVVVLKDSKAWEEGAWVQVATSLGGRWLGITMAAAGMISSAGQFGAMLLGCSRIPFVLAEDGYLPKWLTQLHAQFGTPVRAILVSAVFYTVLSYESFKDLAVVDVVMYSSSLVLEFLALATLRRKEPEMPRPFRIPGGWAVLTPLLLAPTALIVFAIWSRVNEKGQLAVWASLVALLSGPVIWHLCRPSRGISST